MSRSDEAFHVLKVIRREVDETQDVIARGSHETANDRALADDCIAAARGEPSTRGARSGATALHTLCRRVIDDREKLAAALEHIRLAIAGADLPPRTRNLGKGARGTDATQAES